VASSMPLEARVSEGVTAQRSSTEAPNQTLTHPRDTGKQRFLRSICKDDVRRHSFVTASTVVTNDAHNRVMLLIAASLLVACAVESGPGDVVNINCPLDGSATTQSLRFKAHFSGGHDDTRASLTARLNDQSLACDDGSKTELEGEEGEISLECRFSLSAGAGTKHVLSVQVRWHHAQYTNFALEPG
jgi:hypothetical protein